MAGMGRRRAVSWRPDVGSPVLSACLPVDSPTSVQLAPGDAIDGINLRRYGLPPRVALVSCVKLKSLSPAPARDLYTSALFRGLRRFAESRTDAWYVLSAEHGVLRPETVVAPYDKTLNRMPKIERLAWADRVGRQLLELLPAGAEISLLAGRRYREYVEPFLREHALSVEVPFEGMGLGKQLRRLNEFVREQRPN